MKLRMICDCNTDKGPQSAPTSAGRQSPFRRQPSTNSPSPLRASTPSTSPTKPSLFSPARQNAFAGNKDYASSPTSSHQRTSRDRNTGSTVASPTTEQQVPAPEQTSRDIRPESPVRRLQNQMLASATSTPRTSSDIGSVPTSPSTQILVAQESLKRAEVHGNMSMRQPAFTSKSTSGGRSQPLKNSGVYNSIPAPLLRSLRESFEVLDPNATGSLAASALPSVLDQIGLPVDSKTLSSFFPAGTTSSLSLAAYLDMLCGPISQLSSQDELSAAFGAFDVDDSGQIDVQDLRQALLRTVPEPGESNPGARLAETAIDAILQDFMGRKAFGPKTNAGGRGLQAPRGDVFKWRDFVNSVNGKSDAGAEVAVA